MAQGMFMAWSQPVSADVDAEFNEWYETVHVPQIREAIPSITAVNRFVLADGDPDAPVNRYLACYTFDGEAPSAVSEAMMSAAMGGKFDMTTTIDMTFPPDMRYLTHLSSL